MSAPVPLLGSTSSPRTSSLNPTSPESSDPSPARGRETRTALLQRLRPPPLVHSWDCYIERPTTSNSSSSSSTSDPAAAASANNSSYRPHLTHLLNIADVRSFWSLYNNLPLSTLPQRHTCHLFHAGIKPLWEDPRNYRGGSWTFRIPRSQGPAFFTELSLLAIGEQLQNVIEDKTRVRFQDDICGVSFSPRNATVTLVSVWNRDAENESGIKRLLQAILDGVGAEIKPKEGSWYYKRHDAHEGFVLPTEAAGEKGAASDGAVSRATAVAPVTEKAGNTTMRNTENSSDAKSSEPVTTMDKIEDDVRKVRKILDELKISKDTEYTGMSTDAGSASW